MSEFAQTRFAQPRSLDEALATLDSHPAFRPVAGCTDLMVTDLESRSDMPAVLDLSRVDELSGIEETDGGLAIGATTTFTQIGSDPRIGARFPALAAAARVVGGWQIQNRATIGGNIANASPAGDSLPALLALGAEIVLGRRGRERTLPYDDFHVGYRKTALEPGELVVRVLLKDGDATMRQGFRKVGTREAQAISKVVVAARVRVDSGAITEARIAAGSVAATPIRLARAEAAVLGAAPTEETADAAGRAAAEEVEPIDDVRSTATYRRFALRRVVRRLLLELAPAAP